MLTDLGQLLSFWFYNNLRSLNMKYLGGGEYSVSTLQTD